MANKCRTCEYYDKIDDTDFGLCLRYPPTAGALATYSFSNNIIDNRRPRMSKDDKCGEYKEKV